MSDKRAIYAWSWHTKVVSDKELAKRQVITTHTHGEKKRCNENFSSCFHASWALHSESYQSRLKGRMFCWVSKFSEDTIDDWRLFTWPKVFLLHKSTAVSEREEVIRCTTKRTGKVDVCVWKVTVLILILLRVVHVNWLHLENRGPHQTKEHVVEQTIIALLQRRNWQQQSGTNGNDTLCFSILAALQQCYSYEDERYIETSRLSSFIMTRMESTSLISVHNGESCVQNEACSSSQHQLFSLF